MSRFPGAPGIVIAAPYSGSGKTTVTLGILSALRRRGCVVQSYKCGPDFIDPGHHELAAGRESFNLDTWAMSREEIVDIVKHTSADATLGVAEGVMGLFDGVNDQGRCGRGSTADLAAVLGWPVVLVLDVSAQVETAAALALGCAKYRSDIEIAGVILNRVAGERHFAMIAPAFERIGMKVFGGLVQTDSVQLPERHLGLVQAGEITGSADRLSLLGDLISSAIDLDALLQSAKQVQVLNGATGSHLACLTPPGQRIAIANDRAFSFTYPHLLRSWRAAGAEIKPFSPLANEAPAIDADAVWLPGGYPELHAEVLTSSEKFISGVRSLASRGVPVHGECGGYMVLGDGLVDADGTRHQMLGLLRLETSFAQHRLHMGYRRARLRADCVLGSKTTMLYGHEFHFSSIVSCRDEPLFDCQDAGQAGIREVGSRSGSVTGSFVHLIHG